MKDCTYTYVGDIELLKNKKDEPYTIEKLKNALLNLRWNGTDYVYSLSLQDSQEKLIRSIKELNKYEESKKATILKDLRGEEDVISDSFEGAMSIPYFIDFSGLAVIDGKNILTPFNIDDYKANESARIAEAKRISEEEALKIVENDLKAKQSLVNISPFIHRLAISKYIGVRTEKAEDKEKLKANFVKQALGMEDLPALLKMKDGDSYPILEKLFDTLDTNYKHLKGKVANSKAVRGINIISSLKNNESAKLFTHIDYAIISDDGFLRIYNYKVSSQKEGDWSYEKKLKFEQEVAFLIQMLKNNGANITGIAVYNIPMHIKFELNSDGSFNDSVIESIYTPPISSVSLMVNNDNKKSYRECVNRAKYFIGPSKNIEVVKDELFDEADKMLELIFPSLQVSSTRIDPSVYELIKRAPQTGDSSTPLRIVEFPNNDDYRYIVYIDGEEHIITQSKRNKEKNPQIIELVNKNLYRLNDTLSDYVSTVVDAIKSVYKKKMPYLPLNVKNETFLKQHLSKYFEGDINYEEGKVTKYYWDMDDSLSSLGILLFKKGDVIDVVVLSDKYLEGKPQYDFGDNILGGYVFNNKFLWKGDYGNVETVRALCILNEMGSQLKDFKLGGIKVLSRQGNSRSYHLQDVVESKFTPLIKVLKQYNPEAKVHNNLAKFKYEDLLTSIFTEYDEIMHSDDSYVYAAVKYNFGTEIDDLMKADLRTKEEKRAALFELMQTLENTDRIRDILRNIPQNINSSNKANKAIARLYDMISKAYLYYSNETLGYEKKLTSWDKNMFTSFTVPNANIGIVVENLRTTIDSIAEEVENEYTNNLLGFIMDFLRAKGYTSIQNKTLGNQTHLFNNLYELDSQGKKTMYFKNPYTDSSLDGAERKFLKYALYYFNKYRFKDNWKFKSANDPEIEKYIRRNREYLWVPLVRASKSTRRLLNVVLKWKNSAARVLKWVSNPERWMDEAVNYMSKYERDSFYDEESIRNLKLRDPFDLTEQERNEYLASEKELGSDYFETNVASLLIDRMFRKIHVEKMNRMMVGTRAILTQLQILGDESGGEASENFKKEIEYIKEYIKSNVFYKPIAGETSLKIMGAVSGIKKSTVLMLLGGNLVAAARDIENGLMENFVRTSSKYMTDISAKSLSKAYVFVIRNASFSAMKTTLLNKLCLMYRLSNTDTARISERLKTNRQGLSNWDNIAYSTLRGPDFLNRMTLFIARAIEDGVIDPDNMENSAWTIEKIKDANGITVETIKYNWKKDKRFSIYASGNKSHPQYQKQKLAFLELIRKWNRDHPNRDQLIDINDDNINLPTPYSNRDIVTIKAVADNIYGAYDKSLKARYELLAAGWAFGMFTTWMNGMYNNWFMKPGQYNVFKMREVQSQDENGNFLFLDKNGQIVSQIIEGNTKRYVRDDGTEVSPEGLEEVKEMVPVIVQGVIYTLKNVGKMLMQKDGWKKTRLYLNSSPEEMANLKLVAWTLLLGIILAALFRLLFSPLYKDKKKELKKEENKLGALLLDMAYKPFNAATDSLYGALNLFWKLEDTSTPMIRVPEKLIDSTFKKLVGDISFGQYISDNLAIGRSVKSLL